MTKNISDRLRQSGISAMETLADYCDKTPVEQERLVRKVTGESDEVHAYAMGRDYQDKGANTVNHDIANFRTAELTAAWERGFKDAKGGKP